MANINPPGPNPKGPSQRFPYSSEPVTSDPKGVDQGHSNSDLDSSRFAQHHTLGPNPNQASPGNHIHDGAQSKQITDLTLLGIFQSANLIFGSVDITPVANTPTFASVVYALPSTCTKFYGYTTPFSGSVGTQVMGTGITNITATTANIFIYRTNTTVTTVYYLIVGMP